MPNRKILLALAVGAVLVALAGCGSSSKTSSATPAAPGTTASMPTTSTSSSRATSSGSAAATGASETLQLAADPSGALKYDKKTLTAKAGKVTIDFTNKAPLPHNVTVQTGTSGPTLGATPTFTGGTKSVTVNLKPGTYTYFCSVPGHRQAGMLGTLSVK